ncbi:hypothetical protein SAMN04488128_1093 [Chitinophaga eiseniae]|uniref:Uncharacterized protein n=1 Tax=Chitinophaga eiseniae TaxID=634771 RepID=A0A1T4U4U7_9BACT|nr:hypothetical protein [Chitinophaga eiseniae]SKA47609.1 hypothetical protein SAMN04488128_1093 [Chitinophaga eiseniae]
MSIARDKQAYAVITCLLFLNVVLDVGAGFSIRGYWPDRILFYLWLIGTVYIIVTYYKERFVKIYTWVLVALTLLSTLPMMIPFLTIVSVGFAQDTRFRKVLPDNYRVQMGGKSPIGNRIFEVMKGLGPLERLEGAANMNLLERDLGTAKLEDIQSVKVLQMWRDSSRIELQFPDTTVQFLFNRK